MSGSAAPTDRSGWNQVPLLPPKGGRGLSVVEREALALVVAIGGPLVRSTVIPDSRPVLVLAVGALSTLLLAMTPERHWPLRLLVPLGAAAVVWVPEGQLMAAWIAIGIGLSDWVVRRRRPLPFVPAASEGAVAPVLVLLALAAWRGHDTNSAFAPLILAVLAVVVTGIGVLTGGRLDHWAAAFGRAVGRVVSRVVFVVLGVVMIPLPWVVRRGLRVDPLELPLGPTAWLSRSRTPAQASQPWVREPVIRGGSLWWRARSALVAPICVAVLFGSIVGFRQLTAGPTSAAPATPNALNAETMPDDGIPAAYVGADWYPEYRDDFNWIMQQTVAWRPLHPRRLADVRTRHVNVEGGFRRSWTPPPCDCPTVTIWLYGGSTTFGLGQRDEHTIASELSRVAWDDGYRVVVENRGMPGHMHWTEAQRFAWDLTVDPAPDMVLFYDGVNEIWGAQHLNNERLGDIDEPVEPLTEDIWRGMRGDVSEVPPGPPGASLVEPARVESMDPAELGALASERYERSRKISADTAAANSLPIVWFWQPSRLSRPRVQGEPYSDAKNERYLRSLYDGAESRVPDGVVDLTDVFDVTQEPLFSDEVHHNEDGATLVATAMWEQIAAQVQALSTADPGGA